jgi:acetyltransferase-like isoleucine patch superfamily enzyme
MIGKIIASININILMLLGRSIYVSNKTKFRGITLFYVSRHGKLIIGEVVFGASVLNPTQRNINKIIVGGVGNLENGDNVGMSGVSIGCYNSIKIGNNFIIGGDVLIVDSNFHSIDYLSRRADGGVIKTSPITICDDVFIGARSIILKGVTLGSRAIIGAGSVVRESVASNSKHIR